MSIRTKLVGIITLILGVAAATIIVFATTLFSRENVARIQESNLDSARLVGAEIHNDLVNLSEKMRLLGTTLLLRLSRDNLDSIQRPFFEREKDLIGQTVLSLRRGELKPVNRIVHHKLARELGLTDEEVYLLHTRIQSSKLKSGEEFIRSDRLKGNIPVLTIAIPLITDDRGTVTHATIATVLQSRFLKAVESGSIIVSFLVDKEGYLLAHPDQKRVLARENLTHLPIVKQLLRGKTNNGQTRFIDPEKKVPFLGAFKKIGFGGIGVISQVEEAKALEAARKVRITSIIISAMVAVAGFMIVFLFSLSLTRPLFRLVGATQKILDGDYDISLKKPGNDEIGDLTRSFTTMASGLAEREKIKNAFSKFHSKEVADEILSGNLNLSGERKDVTIFFSDIRSFTTLSEKLQPEQVVELVNGYMTRMVSIIFAHGGVVDKYVGDAIMAVYGTPVSYGDDALRAVSATLRMRAELERFNAYQTAAGRLPIAIGMGLHSGPVVAGNVGSPQRMEYTILGDSVNLASRMESTTKAMKTDILISSDTYELVKDHIECLERGSTKVKGKEKETLMYEVKGFLPGKEYIAPETGTTGETDVHHLQGHPNFDAEKAAEMIRMIEEAANDQAAAANGENTGAGVPTPPPFRPDLTGVRTPPPPRPEMTEEFTNPILQSDTVVLDVKDFQAPEAEDASDEKKAA